MAERAAEQKREKIVLMPRDVRVLSCLSAHRAISSGQLAALCFADSSYETARKRLRRLHQSGVIDAGSSSRMEGPGRPELIYFLSDAGARALEQNRRLPPDSVPSGPPHTYHKERYLRLVDVRLSMLEAVRQNVIVDFEWTARESAMKTAPDRSERSERSERGLEADATIVFSYPDMDSITVSLEIDTGNFRQAQHWEPKLRAFLELGHPIWVITNSEARISRLRKWTAPLLAEAGVGPGKCVFAVYDEIMQKGVFAASWYRTDGSVTNLRPR